MPAILDSAVSSRSILVRLTRFARVFRPDDGEIAWAHRVLSAGEGAVAIDGAMVGAPVRIRARSILNRAQLIQLR